MAITVAMDDGFAFVGHFCAEATAAGVGPWVVGLRDILNMFFRRFTVKMNSIMASGKRTGLQVLTAMRFLNKSSSFMEIIYWLQNNWLAVPENLFLGLAVVIEKYFMCKFLDPQNRLSTDADRNLRMEFRLRVDAFLKYHYLLIAPPHIYHGSS